jgi:hypothetical protein
MKKIVLLLALLLAGVSAFGQEAKGNIPADVFYMLPEFGQGMVYFFDQGPAQGQMNICAVDQTLRFLDNDGKELSSNADNITRVVIGDVIFVRVDGAYYRLYPITDDLTVAYRRDVEIIRDVKKGAYGTESRTSSIRNVGTFQADGMMYTLQQAADYPYHVTESCSLFQAGSVIPFNKRNLRKQFPERKDDLDAWLKANRNLPKSLEETKAFLLKLANGETL